MMRGLPYNPLAVMTFPAVLVRILWNILTFFPAAAILGLLWLMRVCGANERLLASRMHARDTGWAVRTMDRQITDLGVIFGEIRRRFFRPATANQKAQSS